MEHSYTISPFILNESEHEGLERVLLGVLRDCGTTSFQEGDTLVVTSPRKYGEDLGTFANITYDTCERLLRYSATMHHVTYSCIYTA